VGARERCPASHRASGVFLPLDAVAGGVRTNGPGALCFYPHFFAVYAEPLICINVIARIAGGERMHKVFDEAESLPQGEAENLQRKAAQCRRLAIGIADRQTCEALATLAEEYEREAALRGAPRSYSASV